MTIAQYFHRVKSICQEIIELNLMSIFGESKMKRIIIHGLRLEYKVSLLLYEDDLVNNHL